MKLSDLIKIWDFIHVKDVGELGFCDLEYAVGMTVGIENDAPGCLPAAKKEKDEINFSVADFRVFLAENLPYYEAEDKDDFLYIVRASDIERVSLALFRQLTGDEGI